MHFHKYPYPANFEFPSRVTPGGNFRTRLGRYAINLRTSADDIYHLKVSGKGWIRNESIAGLKLPRRRRIPAGSGSKLEVLPEGGFRLLDTQGKVILQTASRFFGQCGEASIFQFLGYDDDQFYGLGEKWTGFEHSGKTTKFWNTDVWGDFYREQYIHGDPAPDPAYLSIPYLIIKRGNTYVGLLMDNPFATFISTGFKASIADQMEATPANKEFAEEIGKAIDSPRASDFRIQLGAEQGQPNLYVIYGPTLPELTRKVQNLMGTTPRPPAWSLGYHQCRWGYESERDLLELDRNFREHAIPVDGLWLDIDYMDGYRVFTFAKKHFADPKKTMARLARNGRKVIPILDPGVKLDADYPVYQRGEKNSVFCRNPQGGNYVGLVWPGETVFPDFSMNAGRRWWAAEVRDFAAQGVHGAWLDMNDPSTGPSETGQMLFDKGRKEHTAFHNQYALGMAMASREGFLAAHPNQRPFLLSRSGFTGSNRYTAIWTGDNYSNYHHLRNSIATTLNLALSGIPFNGPDAGGFGGDTTPELISDWFKAGFLFPFFRNHSLKGTRQQEPWAFDRKTNALLRHYIRLRYRFRPYLYQLFLRQEESGEAILRPLFYDFADTKKLPLGRIDDQFMVGENILQAPFVDEKRTRRPVVLPGSCRWLDLSSGRWVEGDQVIEVEAAHATTPIYIRDQSILPLARLEEAENRFDGGAVDFHIFLSDDGHATTRYEWDDGTTFDYRSGKSSVVMLSAVRRGQRLEIIIDQTRDGFGAGDFTFTVGREIRGVTVNGIKAKACKAQGIAVGKWPSKTWKAAHSPTK